MSRDVGRRSVPLKNMCSAKWAIPFVSARLVAGAGGEHDEARRRLRRAASARSARACRSGASCARRRLMRPEPPSHSSGISIGSLRAGSRRRRARSWPRPRPCRRERSSYSSSKLFVPSRAGRTPTSTSSPKPSGARKSISARARIIVISVVSGLRRTRRACAGTRCARPRVRQVDGVVDVPHASRSRKRTVSRCTKGKPVHGGMV